MVNRIVWKTRALIFLVACTMVCFSATGGYAYSDPSWAPDWFKQCTQNKQWAEWTFDYLIPPDPSNLSPTSTDRNYVIQNYQSPKIELTGGMSWIPGKHFNRSGLIGIGDAATQTTLDFHTFMDNEPAPLIKNICYSVRIWLDHSQMYQN